MAVHAVHCSSPLQADAVDLAVSPDASSLARLDWGLDTRYGAVEAVVLVEGMRVLGLESTFALGGYMAFPSLVVHPYTGHLKVDGSSSARPFHSVGSHMGVHLDNALRANVAALDPYNMAERVAPLQVGRLS